MKEPCKFNSDSSKSSSESDSDLEEDYETENETETETETESRSDLVSLSSIRNELSKLVGSKKKKKSNLESYSLVEINFSGQDILLH